jgi:HD-GYP domain-containing protein (c-di-GMP phosphodiesterase class II)
MRGPVPDVVATLQRDRDAAGVARRNWLETVDALRDPLMVHDAAGRVVRANRAYAQRAGMDYQALIGRRYWECFPKRAGPLACAGSPEEFTVDSGEAFVCHPSQVAHGGAGQVLCLFEDVTQKRAAELRIRTLNTLYETSSAVNRAMVDSHSRKQIAERIALICTEKGLWHGAWVGFVDAATGRILPEAWSASMTPHVGKMKVSADPAIPEGQGPTGRAVRTGAPYFCDDVFADPVTLPWRAFAQALGINTVAAIPLRPKNSAPGVVNLYSVHKGIFTPEVRALVIELGADITFVLEALEDQAKLRRGLEATIGAIAATIETRDPYTAGHQRRVAALAAAIAAEMGLPAPAVEGIHFGALIHDLGKVQVPAEILAKPARLTPLEFELIKTHPRAGYDIVKEIEFPWPVALMVLQHHERLDGSGYPQGLKGDAISLEARILAVADVVEAMSSHRPYRPGLGIEAALKEIEAKRGTWFEPAAVDACLHLFREKRFAFETQ